MSQAADIELEWEDWDGRSPFFHHCIAGSIAGVAEHTILYPFDTIKTHMQAYCSTCPKNPANQTLIKGAMQSPTLNRMAPNITSSSAAAAAADGNMWSTMRRLMKYGHTNHILPNSALENSTNRLSTAANMHTPTAPPATFTSISPYTAGTATATVSSPPKHVASAVVVGTEEAGFLRLWRGVQSMALGSAPAHALYFSSYEAVKSAFLSYQKQQQQQQLGNVSHSASPDLTLGPIGASIAGATATFLHDTIMCPMDTIKQRMQLGHYNSVYDAFVTIVKTSGEGWIGLYRSFGVTLLSNIPYGMIMFTTNEWLRGCLLQWKHGSDTTTQQQYLDVTTTMMAGMGAGTIASGLTSPLDRVKTRLQTQQMGMVPPPLHSTTFSPHVNLGQAQAMVDCGVQSGKSCVAMARPQYTGFHDALASILKEEGYAGLWRGVGPRILTQAPAVAISWSFYEMAKRWLAGDSIL